MPTEVWRPGDYRVCPSCGARHKVQDLRCERCNTVLAGTPVQHGAPATIAVAAARSSRGLRALLAIGLVIALVAGLWVRSLFRGAALQDSVEASGATSLAVPAPQPTWTPPILSYPPIVGYNQGVPPSMAALAIQSGSTVGAEPTAAPAGMTSIAPPSEPTRKTTFTNDDLERTRGQAALVPIAPVASAALVTSGDAAAARAASVSDDEMRDWISRVRDREDDLLQAQAKVRRLEAEAEARRAHAAAASSDLDAHEKAQREFTDALEDLEKAERKVSEKQRDLDEARVRARAAGVRFEQ